jgi:hypothetical protein
LALKPQGAVLVLPVGRCGSDDVRAAMIRPNPAKGRPLHHADNEGVFSALEELDGRVER